MLAPTDCAEARRRMVDGQLRPNRVSDPALLAAMLELPRERFVPAPQRARAHADEEVAIAPGRAMPSPMAIARLLQLLAPQPGERVLVLGAGSGYGAALLGRLGLVVVAVEDDPALLALAERATHDLDLGASIRWVAADPAQGFAAAAPYECCIVEGAVPALPTTLAAQLAPGGRMVGVVGGGGRVGRATIGRMLGGGCTVMPAFDLAMPRLPAFFPAAGFVF